MPSTSTSSRFAAAPSVDIAAPSSLSADSVESTEPKESSTARPMPAAASQSRSFASAAGSWRSSSLNWLASVPPTDQTRSPTAATIARTATGSANRRPSGVRRASRSAVALSVTASSTPPNAISRTSATFHRPTPRATKAATTATRATKPGRGRSVVAPPAALSRSSRGFRTRVATRGTRLAARRERGAVLVRLLAPAAAQRGRHYAQPRRLDVEPAFGAHAVLAIVEPAERRPQLAELARVALHERGAHVRALDHDGFVAGVAHFAGGRGERLVGLGNQLAGELLAQLAEPRLEPRAQRGARPVVR